MTDRQRDGHAESQGSRGERERETLSNRQRQAQRQRLGSGSDGASLTAKEAEAARGTCSRSFSRFVCLRAFLLAFGWRAAPCSRRWAGPSLLACARPFLLARWPR
eukprot:14676918-Alexandrium_andersonii.AAC.1